ncbi:MAG: phosphate signaling complex protein PhoU [Lachnospiraceae bacterium]|nr:phosphate signaling complex protein PhoU [Lachnospiraceae bacterium]
MTTRKVYIAELEELTDQVNQMGTQLEHMIDQVIKALTDLDLDMAVSIIREDDIIDDMERRIERTCITLVAKQQPVVATDLRRVTSIMRLISDVERIADHCGDIAEYIIELAKEPEISMPKGLLEMFRHMRSMVSRTINSFIEENIEVINQIVRDDDVVDGYFDSIKEELITSMKNNPEHMRAYVDYLLIVKYVERMADHATNIAEWVAFIITGDLEEYMNS